MVFIRAVNKAHSLSHPIWQITVTARANKEHRKAAFVLERERGKRCGRTGTADNNRK